MALTAADLTRIYKYQAYTLGSRAGGPLTYNAVLDLLQEQIDHVNAIDTERGTTFASQIQADLDSLDELSENLTTAQNSENAGLIKADVLEWSPGGKTAGFSAEMNRLTKRIAGMLSQTYQTPSTGLSQLYLG